jgi:CelD/BcsL family acetyltransferase involved in cellulose biosynthesis
LNIINGGRIGEDSEETCRAMLDCALKLAKEEQLEFVALSYVPCDHVLFNLAGKTVPSWSGRDWGVVPNEHWRMTLPVSFEEFLKKRSKKHRYWLKRLPRVLEDDFPAQVRMRGFTSPEEAAQFCSEAGSVARLTYQHQLGSAFNDDEEYRDRCRMLAGQGALRGYIFYVKDRPVAYWFVTAYQDTLHLNYTGYDPEYRKYEVGTVLLMKLIEDHCGGAMKKVDFGLGAALYKERFGDESFQEATVRIYSGGFRSQLLKVVAALNARIVARLKSLLTRLGLLQRLKTFWRARLVRGG